MSSYREFGDAIRSISFKDAGTTPAAVICLYGPSEYLQHKARRALAERWLSETGGPSTLHDGERLDAATLTAIVTQRSLFEAVSLHIIDKIAKKSEELAQFFTKLSTPSMLRNSIILVFDSAAIPVKMRAATQQFAPKVIPCFAPSPLELPGFVKALGRRYGLQMTDDAGAFLSNSVGQNLFKLENEIQKLALIFSESSHPVNASAIEAHCGLLREDLVFKIENHLMAGDLADGQWLINDLIRRGENAGAILGFIAHHCRKALGVRGLLAEGANPRAISAALKLPFGAVSHYTQYVKRPGTIKKLERALCQCQKADMRIKTSRASADLLLAEVLLAFDA